MPSSPKIVVFDLDETLGYFVEFGIFWDCIENFLRENKFSVTLTQEDFNQILDLFPEFIRPNILSILFYLKNKKKQKICHKLMIYTNNQGPREWAHFIKKYFEKNIQYNLFNQIIAAFKVNGKHVEICRTKHDKTHNDLVKCTQISHNTQICFLDDNYFPEMTHENVYYIHVKPYVHDLPFEEMISRFENSQIGERIIGESKSSFRSIMMTHFKRYAYDYIEKKNEDYDVDKIITKKIMLHLQAFFRHNSKDNQGRPKFTARKNIQYKNKTCKK
jgi:hypothetical protein